MVLRLGRDDWIREVFLLGRVLRMAIAAPRNPNPTGGFRGAPVLSLPGGGGIRVERASLLTTLFSVLSSSELVTSSESSSARRRADTSPSSGEKSTTGGGLESATSPRGLNKREPIGVKSPIDKALVLDTLELADHWTFRGVSRRLLTLLLLFCNGPLEPVPARFLPLIPLKLDLGEPSGLSETSSGTPPEDDCAPPVGGGSTLESLLGGIFD